VVFRHNAFIDDRCIVHTNAHHYRDPGHFCQGRHPKSSEADGEVNYEHFPLHTEIHDAPKSLQHINQGGLEDLCTHDPSVGFFDALESTKSRAWSFERRQLTAKSSRCTAWILASEHVRVLNCDMTDLHSETTLVQSFYR
jgi:hypothetical protein